MSRSTRHAIAVVALALAGLVVAVVLGVVVSRAASQNVALGGVDLGSGRHLVVRTTTTVTQTGTITAPPASTTTTTTTTRTTTAPPVGTQTTDDHGGDDDHGGSGDGDSDD